MGLAALTLNFHESFSMRDVMSCRDTTDLVVSAPMCRPPSHLRQQQWDSQRVPVAPTMSVLCQELSCTFCNTRAKSIKPIENFRSQLTLSIRHRYATALACESRRCYLLSEATGDESWLPPMRGCRVARRVLAHVLLITSSRPIEADLRSILEWGGQEANPG
nr:hypothetical protein Iba_chr10cCG4530 [Ipomoea batatas]